jgi:hypothetical protein
MHAAPTRCDLPAPSADSSSSSTMASIMPRIRTAHALSHILRFKYQLDGLARRARPLFLEWLSSMNLLSVCMSTVETGRASLRMEFLHSYTISDRACRFCSEILEHFFWLIYIDVREPLAARYAACVIAGLYSRV